MQCAVCDEIKESLYNNTSPTTQWITDAIEMLALSSQFYPDYQASTDSEVSVLVPTPDTNWRFCYNQNYQKSHTL